MAAISYWGTNLNDVHLFKLSLGGQLLMADIHQVLRDLLLKV